MTEFQKLKAIVAKGYSTVENGQFSVRDLDFAPVLIHAFAESYTYDENIRRSNTLNLGTYLSTTIDVKGMIDDINKKGNVTTFDWTKGAYNEDTTSYCTIYSNGFKLTSLPPNVGKVYWYAINYDESAEYLTLDTIVDPDTGISYTWTISLENGIPSIELIEKEGT